MNIQIFNFQNQSVRIEFHNGEPLFCLTDVAEILLIKNANPTRFNLKDDGVHKMYSVDSKGRKNEITFINEPNLYRVIFRSNKSEAVKFQDWIFEEVIPQIRKTGTYSASTKTTKDERTGLRQAVTMLVGKTNINHSAAYKLVHHRFSVAHIDELSSEQIPQAVEYIHRLILDNSLHGEVLDKKPEPIQSKLSDSDFAELCELVINYAHLDYKLFTKLREPLLALGSPLVGDLYKYTSDSKRGKALKLVERLSPSIEAFQEFDFYLRTS